MTPFEQRRDALARLLCASLMNLIKDATGSNLPDDLWHQMIPKANAILLLTSKTGDHKRAKEELEE